MKFFKWINSYMSLSKGDYFVSILIASLIMFGVLLFSIPTLVLLNSNLAFQATGQVGDTIGGTTAPFIGFAGIVITFFAFYVQFKANEQQRRDIKRERFENKFYEMLHLHRENISELELAGTHKGRKAFVKMYHELRFMYHLLNRCCQDSRLYASKSWKTRVAYHHFFFGVDELTNPITDGVRQQVETQFIGSLLRIQNAFERHKARVVTKGSIKERPYETRLGLPNELETDFYPFDGHVSKLGHYYRHLYQTTKYIATNQLKLKWSEVYDYVRLLRAQLSNHEQTLIYYNSFFRKGHVWWEDKPFKEDKNKIISYFLDYRFIRNLPFNLTTFGANPQAAFELKMKKQGLEKLERMKKLKELFEWAEDDLL